MRLKGNHNHTLYVWCLYDVDKYDNPRFLNLNLNIAHNTLEQSLKPAKTGIEFPDTSSLIHHPNTLALIQLDYITMGFALMVHNQYSLSYSSC